MYVCIIRVYTHRRTSARSGGAPRRGCGPRRSCTTSRPGPSAARPVYDSTSINFNRSEIWGGLASAPRRTSTVGASSSAQSSAGSSPVRQGASRRASTRSVGTVAARTVTAPVGVAWDRRRPKRPRMGGRKALGARSCGCGGAAAPPETDAEAITRASSGPTTTTAAAGRITVRACWNCRWVGGSVGNGCLRLGLGVHVSQWVCVCEVRCVVWRVSVD